ncbi:alpha/beta hydrolase [Luteimonas gilva]|uniref:Alpha/beta hydrolase n=1 Tax=Luteimonas gilva TaxID=2572684 RepID=A0A4U5JMP2_9GAMM|nr:alpha/beta hydrolase [Luteimonas gilva]TKR30465.1 alpha/beta hydrolase [Luteimonas gilva]
MNKTLLSLALAFFAAGTVQAASPSAPSPATPSAAAVEQVRYRTTNIDGVDVFYREAGPADAPVLLLLHGFPASSHMFRDLMPRLAQRYRVVAPDYPGFGYSAAPPRDRFAYTFDHYAQLLDVFAQRLGLTRYALYAMDYGAPVGFRLATAHPERVTAIVVQNGNAYEEGIAGFWDPIKAYWRSGAPADREALRAAFGAKSTQWQYTHGVPDLSLVSPDAWTVDQARLDRAGNQDIQLDLFYDYRNNLPLYPQWQRYFRERKPPMLVLWGRNDEIFVAAGAAPYRRDNPNAQIRMLDTGHFALETHGPQIAGMIRDFLDRNVSRTKQAP